MGLTDTDYAGLADLKSYLGIPDTADDTELSLAVTAASRAIDRSTNRYFGLDNPAVERVYTWERDHLWNRESLLVNDIATTSGLVIENDGVAVTDYKLYPSNAEVDGRPYEMVVIGSGLSWSRDPEAIAITAQFGWASVPDVVKQACLLQASRFFKRKESPYGVAGSPDLGNELRLLAKLDPDVEVMLGAVRRWWAAA